MPSIHWYCYILFSSTIPLAQSLVLSSARVCIHLAAELTGTLEPSSIHHRLILVCCIGKILKINKSPSSSGNWWQSSWRAARGIKPVLAHIWNPVDSQSIITTIRWGVTTTIRNYSFCPATILLLLNRIESKVHKPCSWTHVCTSLCCRERSTFDCFFYIHV
jgi:hypothetical protein